MRRTRALLLLVLLSVSAGDAPGRGGVRALLLDGRVFSLPGEGVGGLLVLTAGDALPVPGTVLSLGSAGSGGAHLVLRGGRRIVCPRGTVLRLEKTRLFLLRGWAEARDGDGTRWLLVPSPIEAPPIARRPPVELLLGRPRADTWPRALAFGMVAAFRERARRRCPWRPEAATLRRLASAHDLARKRVLEGCIRHGNDLPGPWRLRALVFVLEVGDAGQVARIVRGLTPLTVLRLRPHLRRGLDDPRAPVRRACALALARAGDLDALALAAREEDASSRAAAAVRRFLDPHSRLLPAPVAPESDLRGSGERITLLRAAEAFLSGDVSPQVRLVRRMLARPLDPGAGRLLAALSRRGVTTLDLERFLAGRGLPAPLLDLSLAMPGTEEADLRRSGEASLLLDRLLAAEERRLRLRLRLERALAAALRAREAGVRNLALRLGGRMGGHLFLGALREHLSEADAVDLPAVGEALRSLLRRGVSSRLVQSLGEVEAWNRTLLALAPTFVPGGEGLLSAWEEGVDP